MSLPKTVKEIFDKYENLSNWRSGDIEREICDSNQGKKHIWTYQNVKIWVADNYRQYPNVAHIYVNCLYDKEFDCLPLELSHLRHLLDT